MCRRFRRSHPVWLAEHRRFGRTRPRSGARQDGEPAQSAHGRAVCAPRPNREAQGSPNRSHPSGAGVRPPQRLQGAESVGPSQTGSGRASQGVLSLVPFFSRKRKELDRGSGRNPNQTSGGTSRLRLEPHTPDPVGAGLPANVPALLRRTAPAPQRTAVGALSGSAGRALITASAASERASTATGQCSPRSTARARPARYCSRAAPNSPRSSSSWASS